MLLSDGWMSKRHKNGQARLFLKQSLANSKSLFYTFIQLSHYCGNYPHIISTNFKGKIFWGVEFVTRSLFCFNELYDSFYQNKVKCVPIDICNMLTVSHIGFVEMVQMSKEEVLFYKQIILQ